RSRRGGEGRNADETHGEAEGTSARAAGDRDRRRVPRKPRVLRQAEGSIRGLAPDLALDPLDQSRIAFEAVALLLEDGAEGGALDGFEFAFLGLAAHCRADEVDHPLGSVQAAPEVVVLA